MKEKKNQVDFNSRNVGANGYVVTVNCNFAGYLITNKMY